MMMRKFFVPAVLLGWLVAPQVGASAQEPDDNAAQLRQCALIEQINERYRCYDSVLRPGSIEAPAPAPTAAPATSPTASPPAVVAIPAPPAAVPSPAVAPAIAVPPVVVPSSTADEAAQDQRNRFGIKERRSEEPDFIDIVIVSITKSSIGKLIYRTEDGQVWLQSDNRRPPVYRRTPFAARIKKGTLGSFFIKPNKGGYSMRVHRRN